MFLFYVVITVDTHCTWRMVGSEVKLAYSAIPQAIHGFHRLRWPTLIMFVPNSCMRRCGRYALDDYDLLFHVEHEGDLYVEIPAEQGRRMAIPTYGVLARILRGLLVDRNFSIANVSGTNMRLVRPRRRRSSLVCCGGSGDDASEEYSIAQNMVFMGADDGNGSPVCNVRSSINGGA